MSSGSQKIRVRILVKAFPQPSQQYDETVCVAGVDVDASALLRLYPIRFRQLPPEQKFKRFDLVQMQVELPRSDTRPESRHVVEDSIRVIGHAKELTDEARVRLWRPFIAQSLKTLQAEYKSRSFGIIRPDNGSLRFTVKRIDETDAADQELSASVFQQASLFESPLTPLQRPEFSFGYRFTSGGHPHEMQLHDWEVQAAYLRFRSLYGDDAMGKLRIQYEQIIPKQHPHFIMGTMHKRPWMFIIIGILRSTLDPAILSDDLFAAP